MELDFLYTMEIEFFHIGLLHSVLQTRKYVSVDPASLSSGLYFPRLTVLRNNQMSPFSSI